MVKGPLQPISRYYCDHCGKSLGHASVGCLFRRMGQTHRVMAVCENYAMIRPKGGTPYVVSLKDLNRDYARVIEGACKTFKDEDADSKHSLIECLADLVIHHRKCIAEIKRQLELIETVRGQIENELWVEE